MNHNEKIILDQLPDIIDEQENKLQFRKNKKYAKAIQIMKNFISKHNRILYGGIAINAVLNKQGQPIYEPKYTFPDFDFYSPKHIEDSILLCNELYDAGYKYVRRIPALFPKTVRIQIDFQVYVADITYMNPHKFKHLPTVTIDDFKYVTPDYMKIDLYLSFSHASNSFRWNKDFCRLSLIDKYYPTEVDKKIKFKVPDSNKHQHLVDNLFKYLTKEQSDDTLFQGYTACSIYEQVSKHKSIDKFTVPGTLEVMYVGKQISDYLDNIMVHLHNQYDQSKYYLMYDTYNGTMYDLLPQKFVVRLVKKIKAGYTTAKDELEVFKDSPLIIIYNFQGQKCPFVSINELNCKVVGYSFLMHYLYIYYSYSFQITKFGKNKLDFAWFYNILSSMYKNIPLLINKLTICRKKYLNKHKLVGYEEYLPDNTRNIFQIMNYNLDNETKQYEFIQRYINTPCVTYYKPPRYSIYTPDIEKEKLEDFEFKYPEKMIKICLVTSTKEESEDEEEEPKKYGSFYLINNIYYGPKELKPKTKKSESSEEESSEEESSEDQKNIIEYFHPVEELTYRRIII